MSNESKMPRIPEDMVAVKQDTTCAVCGKTAHRMYIAGKACKVICGNCAQKAMDHLIDSEYYLEEI